MSAHDRDIQQRLRTLFADWNDPVDGFDVDRFLAEVLVTVRRADTLESPELREQLRAAFWRHQDRIDGFALDAFLDQAVRIAEEHAPAPAAPVTPDWRTEPQVIRLFSAIAHIFMDPEIGRRARDIATGAGLLPGREYITVTTLHDDAIAMAADRGLGPRPLPESLALAAKAGVDATLASAPLILGARP